MRIGYDPEGSHFTWKEKNFFAHAFSEDVGNALMGQREMKGAVDRILRILRQMAT